MHGGISNHCFPRGSASGTLFIISMFLILDLLVCLCRCVRGRETCCCVMASAMEPFTPSVSACQRLRRESSSVVNANLVGPPSPHVRPKAERRLSVRMKRPSTYV